jgi:hypothetical protein
MEGKIIHVLVIFLTFFTFQIVTLPWGCNTRQTNKERSATVLYMLGNILLRRSEYLKRAQLNAERSGFESQHKREKKKTITSSGIFLTAIL